MRSYRRLQVRLSKGDRAKLDAVLSGGVQAVRTVLRALVLCRLDQGRSAAEVQLTAKAVREIGRRYEDRGLAQALHERPRPGAIPVLDASQKQRIIAMVCSEPPEGRARWTLKLLADKLVELEVVESVSDETVRRTLKKTRSSRGRRSSGASRPRRTRPS